MPCRVDKVGRSYVWYCCNCEDGPFSLANNSYCPNDTCNFHKRCSPGTNPMTPPRSPPPTSYIYDATRKNAASPSDIAKPVPAEDELRSIVSPEDKEPDTRHDSRGKRKDRPSKDTPHAPGHKPEESLANIARQATLTVLDFLHTLPSNDSLPSISGYKECPTAGASSAGRRKSSLLQAAGRSEKSQARKHDKDDTKRRHDESDSNDEKPRLPQDLEVQGTDGAPNQKYACPFFKNNPHRFRHVVSCSSGYSDFSRLK